VALVIFRFQKITLKRILESMKTDPKYAHPKDFSRIRDALLVMSQHNCLDIALPALDDEGAGVGSGILYGINTEAVLNRLRIPKSLGAVKTLFGETGLMIAEEFALHGRLNMPQVMRDVVARMAIAFQDLEQERERELEEQQEEGGEVVALPPLVPNPDPEMEVRQIFERMAASRFLEPVGTLVAGRVSGEGPDDFAAKPKSALESVLSGAVTVKKPPVKRGAKAAGAVSTSVTTAARKRKRPAGAAEDDDNDLPIEMRLMMQAVEKAGADAGVAPAAGAGSSSKFLKAGPESTVSSAKAATATGVVVGARGRKMKTTSIIDPTAAGASSSNSSSSAAAAPARPPAAADSTALWTFGWAQFNRYERNQLVTQVVSERMGKLAGSVVRCMLSKSIGLEKESVGMTSHSAPVKVTDIVASLNSDSSGRSSGAHTAVGIKKLLEVMRCDKVSTVSLSRVLEAGGAADGSFMVNIQAIMAFLRRKTAHSIACEKFGDVSGRIFELLQDKMYLDQQRISDLAIAPPRDVRRRMYDMYKHNFIDYIDVSKRADFNTLSTIFLWHVNPVKFKAAAMDSLYKGIYNVRVRRNAECDQKKDVLDLVHRKLGVNLDASLAQRFDVFMTAISRLDNAVLKLADTLVVMDVL
jgi:hypothetical protein